MTVADNSVSADEFERWMQAQGIRFAGKPDAGKTGAGQSVGAKQAIGTLPATAMLPAAASPSSTQVARANSGDVLLQLASFTARDNAERARDTLQAGGVDALRIDEASVNGQPVNTTTTTDFLILGAGIAGAGTFCARGRSGFRLGADRARMTMHK